ncbi:helix-turn-helix domain-containing protein [Flavonifractor plautii]|uniref:helix-turn-helix domain-containing protein n=1 Tax=Flavonifractor plautii TaxID=292800 RepID=UPI001E3F04A2|nr:helix-turn-helix transcriptional regulator [Flavonifractor plautii]MCG4658736.1 helix-turn-helix domain-containing protein [Flavonifractor plautii]MCI7152832.1 helix-turn-helix domain-containing protein [Flavonifractor plautii]UQA27512.1 helix-turn-helix domain-containing protein [Flavonifractor plautii]
MATACGMTLRQYHRFEKGEQKPGFDNLRNMADFYGVSVDWLMGRTERREVWR